MWKSLENNSKLSTGTHGSHKAAANHFYRRLYTFTFKELPSEGNHIVIASYLLARFIWETSQDPTEPSEILGLAIRSCTDQMSLESIKDLKVHDMYGQLKASASIAEKARASSP